MKQSRNSRGLTDSQMGFLLIVPGLAVFLAIILYPFVDAVFTSFTDRSLLYPTYQVVGIQNYLNDVMNKAAFLTSHANGMFSVTDVPNVSVRMAIAVVAVIPLLIAYPFFQKYFVKGITLGSVKG